MVKYKRFWHWSDRQNAELKRVKSHARHGGIVVNTTFPLPRLMKDENSILQRQSW
jgi:hypothetical protein